MSSFLLMVLAVLFATLVLGGLASALYNCLVTLKNRIRAAFVRVDIQLRRRHELIPALITAARTRLGSEAEPILEAAAASLFPAVAARTSLGGDPAQITALGRLITTERQLSAALARLLSEIDVSSPNPPADLEISRLCEELAAVEKCLDFARQAYNEAVGAYNDAREKFPAVLFSEMFGFGLAGFWATPETRAALPPKIES